MSHVFHTGEDGIPREVNSNAIDYGDGTVMVEYTDTGDIAIVPKSELTVKSDN